MNEQANINLLKQCYDAFSKGDIQGVLSHFAQDIDWEMPEVEGISFSGKRRGLAQVADFFKVMGEQQEAREFVPDEFIAQGDRVVVLGHCTFTVKATGLDYSDEWSHAFAIANGKIAKFKEYSDTLRAAQAFQLQGAIAGRGAATGTAAGRPPIH